MLTLHDYQQEAVEAVRVHWYQFQHVLGVAATGSGKTIIFLAALLGTPHDPPLLQLHQRALILAHRTELLEQTAQRISTYWPRWNDHVGLVQSLHNQVDRPILLGSVRTLAQEQRLSQVLAHGPIDYLIIDEAHHANAPSYRYIIETLAQANPQLRHLGVTATPERHDAQGLSAVYESIAFTFGIKELVERGYLTPPRWLGVETDISLEGVLSVAKTGNQRDFQTTPLAERFDTPAMHDVVVQIHQTYAADRKAIAFTPSIQGAQALATALTQAGITATWVSGSHPQRRDLVQAFRDGQYQVVVNAQVLVEGFDQPDVDCIHMVRPTRSDSWYLQCIGRSLRRWPQKHDALIIDYLPLDERNIVLLGDILGLPRHRQIRARPVLDRTPGQLAGTFLFDDTFRDAEGTPITFSVRELDYLGHANAHRWSDAMLAELGTDFDHVLAAQWGMRAGTVQRKRVQHGIPPYQDRGPFTWTAAHEQRLGTAPDYVLAAEWGISKVAVRQRRTKRGIASYRSQHDMEFWTPERLAMLGTDYDHVIADQLGLGVATVKYHRQVHGIVAYGDQPVLVWGAAQDALLGTMPDRLVAERLGVSTGTVRNRRVMLGIPAHQQRRTA